MTVSRRASSLEGVDDARSLSLHRDVGTFPCRRRRHRICRRRRHRICHRICRRLYSLSLCNRLCNRLWRRFWLLQKLWNELLHKPWHRTELSTERMSATDPLDDSRAANVHSRRACGREGGRAW